MKKKLSLLGIVLILVLSLAGCGSDKEKTVYDQAMMEQYADAIIMNFSNMSEADMDSFQDMSDLQLNLMMMQSGLPIEGEDFLTMMEAWKAGVKECGEFIEHGAYELEETNEGAMLKSEITCTERAGNIEFAFDEKMNMESITINAEYSLSEILTKAGLNTLLGMGTVFVVLIFISFIISLFKYIPAIEEKFKKKKAPEAAPAPAAVAAAPAEEVSVSDDSELVAAIAAAIAEYEGTSTDGFVVRSIKRRKSNKWN